MKTKILNTREPNPGTKEAIEKGCRCPVMDNGYGRGYMGQDGVFVYNEDCELHGSHMWIDKEGVHLE